MVVSDEILFEIIDYVLKECFDKVVKLKIKDELFGYGLIVFGFLYCLVLIIFCEFIKLEFYEVMKKVIGNVKSVMKEDIKFFFLMYIIFNYGVMIKEIFENCLNEVVVILLKCKLNKILILEFVIKVIFNLMSVIVVEFFKGM